MRAHLLALVASLALLPSRPAHAEETSFKVIVHPSNGATSVTRRELADMFLKKVTRWPDGEAVHPVEPPEQSKARAYFLNSVIGKSAYAVKMFWSRRVFEGRDVPPLEKRSEDEVVAYVRATPGAVGYVSAGTATAGVKVLAVPD
jgi:ABC-type phosphate transport system substrate-binding protein